MLAFLKGELSPSDGSFNASSLFEDDQESIKTEEIPASSFQIESKDHINLLKILNGELMTDNRAKYDAIVMPAMLGKHSVLYYRTSCERDLCYSFQWKRQTKKGIDVYVCGGCKLKGFNLKIDAVENQFLDNPLLLPHVCEPNSWASEAAKRRFYEATKRLRESDSNEKPAILYRKMVNDIMNDNSLTQEQKSAQVHSLGSFEKHRRALSRAVNDPQRRQVAEKRKTDAERLAKNIEGGLEAVNKLLETLRRTREMLQGEPLVKKMRMETLQ